jgi:hypothetical protein
MSLELISIVIISSTSSSNFICVCSISKDKRVKEFLFCVVKNFYKLIKKLNMQITNNINNITLLSI